MPQALELNHEDVRVIAMQIGVREAARQCGLQEATVQAWSAREGWFKKAAEEKELIEQAQWRKRESQGLSPLATRTASEVLRDYDGDTRLGLAKGLNRGAKRVSELDGDEVLMASQQISHLAKSAALVHGWAQNVTHSMSLEAIAGTVIDQDTLPDCPELE